MHLRPAGMRRCERQAMGKRPAGIQSADWSQTHPAVCVQSDVRRKKEVIYKIAEFLPHKILKEIAATGCNNKSYLTRFKKEGK